MFGPGRIVDWNIVVSQWLVGQGLRILHCVHSKGEDVAFFYAMFAMMSSVL